ncbi:MAG: SpoIID/LytB domain-containing protein [Bacteroidales bacterium]|nr:SpoIID/LytB domain-containing protein [Bacteroidales bacterium]
MSQSPSISVGIMAESSLSFNFNTPYSSDGQTFNGKGIATVKDNAINVTMISGQIIESKTLIFTTNDGNFSAESVTIGVDFHWESQESQTFQGHMKLIVEGDKVRLINILDIEDYLCSNISSEMSATSSMELLKAHTIMSRSWLLAQLTKSKKADKAYNACIETEDERTKWYDREDHDTFDVCADDHCQRYQGITRIVSPLVREAVESTRGQVLIHNNEICDARYYKCCGGITEEFDTCWEPIKHAYLKGITDSDRATDDLKLDFTSEENARAWIMSDAPAFCKVQDKAILKEVLNDYDQTTQDFYRWKVSYSQKELSTLFKQRSGIDVGNIISLTPLARGTSGRIYRLKITGTKRSFILGKELEIRKALSTSHLYSSAFVVDYGKTIAGLPQSFTFTGAGWGHGVGLCQIGAAVMADKGYTHQAILQHYFRGAEIKSL